MQGRPKRNSLGVYGLTKLHGEQNIQRVGCNHIIIRTAWLYSEFGKNFVKTMLNLTATKPQLKVVFDQVGTPTYARDLVHAIMVILEDYKNSLTDNRSPLNCEALPCHSDEFPSKVRRPAFSVLDKTKVKDNYGLKVPYWTESLKKCINNLIQI